VLELLAGLRQPDAGLVTLGGVDQRDLAAADRGRPLMVSRGLPCLPGRSSRT
jgi:ABC-type Fe3+/spermidine/putrescine transport system ATPase subunit